jgi:hypothetical protein
MGKSVYDIPVNVLTLVRKIYALIIVVGRVIVQACALRERTDEARRFWDSG